MRSIHVNEQAYQQLLRTLLDAQHFFLSFDQAEVTQEGVTYTFDGTGFAKALSRALETIGWRDGDPMPPGLPFERLSPAPLEPKKPTP